MNKSLLTTFMVLIFTFSLALAAYAFKCEVKELDGGKITVECKRSDIKKKELKVGDRMEVKKSIEGC